MRLCRTYLRRCGGEVVSQFALRSLGRCGRVLFSTRGYTVRKGAFSMSRAEALGRGNLNVVPRKGQLLSTFRVLSRFGTCRFLVSRLRDPLARRLLGAARHVLARRALDCLRGNTVPNRCASASVKTKSAVFNSRRVGVSHVPRLLRTARKTVTERGVRPVRVTTRFRQRFVFLRPFQSKGKHLKHLLSGFVLMGLKRPVVVVRGGSHRGCVGILGIYESRHSACPVMTFFFSITVDGVRGRLTRGGRVSGRSFSSLDL